MVPHRSKAEPEGIDEDTHWDLLQQCLHDEDLPLAVRVAGSLLLLFGQHLTHVSALTTGHLGVQDSHHTIRLDSTPIRLPQPLAILLTRLVEQQPWQGWSGNTTVTWLFPGSRPGTHRSALRWGLSVDELERERLLGIAAGCGGTDVEFTPAP
ncbi:hypothetical protein ACFWBF_11560 [Streptomyces sp. NPDC060028]|uniref:hypothetical protein n=1 Tax=Streptomyces sp. NPDC060028 TaxID=3347041 RepID=UPI00367D165E